MTAGPKRLSEADLPIKRTGADAQQRETAAIEGFPVEDPNEHR